MTRSLRPLRVLALSLLATLGLGCSGELGDDEDVDEQEEALSDKDVYRLKVITHNIAGGMTFKGAPEAVDLAVADAADYKPDVILLSEICETQIAPLQAKLPAGWSVLYESSYNHPNCGSLGLAVASPYPLTKDVINLPDPYPTDPKAYKALCGSFHVPNRKSQVHACSTHLISAGSDKTKRDETEKARGEQVVDLVKGVKKYLKDNDEVVVAGDFNSDAWRPLMDPLYRVTRKGTMNGPGDFDEADSTDPKREKFKEDGVVCAPQMCRSGEPTHHNSKLDHVFFSHNRIVGEISGDVRGTGGSDHNLLRGSAQVRLKLKKK
jgi:endonuclease/exonuclease/phosphatase family metal-dependent hydrolase